MMFGDTNSVDHQMRENSLGQITYKGVNGEADVLGPINVGLSSSNCAYSSYSREADLIAQNQGYNLSNYRHRVYVLPSGTPCGWAGLGQLGGSQS